MNTKWLLAILGCLAVSSIAALEGATFPYPYKRIDLDNGFRAYLIRAGGPGQIAYVTAVRTGSRDEWEPGRSGYAHFFEHMMFRGTKKYPDHSGVLTRIGADNNAFTSDDMTVYYVVASSESLAQVMDLEADRFKNLDYSEEDFRVEAGAVLGEFNQGRANPFLHLYEAVRGTAFTRHTYRHLTIGLEPDVRSMPEGYEYSRSFFRRYYRPENCVLLLVGDFDWDTAERMIREHYADWEPGYVPPKIQPEPEQREPRRKEVYFPGQTLPILSLNFKGPAWSAGDRTVIATSLLGELAFGESSEVYRRLVLEERKVQRLTADFEPPRDPGLLSVTATVPQQDRLPEIEEALLATAKRFQEEPCDANRLADTKKAFRYGFLMGLETAQQTAFSLLRFVVPTGGIEAVEDYFTTLEDVTPEDVQRAAQTYLRTERLTTVVLYPQEATR